MVKMVQPRSAREIIDEAIRENRAGEWITYGIAIVCVLVGVAAIIAGIVLDQGLVTLAGAIASALFWPAMEAARKTRRENLSIRLLEAPLSRAETATEAADALRKVFYNTFTDGVKEKLP